MPKFAYIDFELASLQQTKDIITDLETAGMKFNMIVANAGEIICSYDEKVKFKQFKATVQKIVWKHNDGCHCEVTKRTYDSVEQYL